MSKVLVNETSLTAIGDAIREKNGTDNKYKPSEMAAAIGAIEAGGGASLPEEAFTISGNCQYKFAYGGFDWFIENYGDKVTTKDISNMMYMFNKTQVKEIPFEINGDSDNQSLSNMFNSATNLTSVPKFNSCKPSVTESMFAYCNNLRYIPEDIESWFDWSYYENLGNSYSGNRSRMFTGCCSLRSIPMGFLAHGGTNTQPSYSTYNNGFSTCYSLDELIDLPCPHLAATWTSNAFANSFNRCCRLKNLTFKMPEGLPYVVNWKAQTIDLTSDVGYAFTLNDSNSNSGITAEKEVKDDATYQALKDDPDWFTTDAKYSRYNHDSAVATINSLPDASAYLATAGGTNTIKFNGAAGALTDGGAINTLTEEEIAVATAKGWTVTLS